MLLIYRLFAGNKRFVGLALWGLLSACCALGQVTSERLLHADTENGNWLTYSGTYRSWRYSGLKQVTAENVSGLGLEWAHQMATTLMVETTPLVVDGVMYVTEPPSNVIALWTPGQAVNTGNTEEHCLSESMFVVGKSTGASLFWEIVSSSGPWTPTWWRWMQKPETCYGTSQLPITQLVIASRARR